MPLKLLAWDNSGSTSGVSHYFELGRTYIEKFRKSFENEDKVNYMTWGTNCVEVSHSELVGICDKKRGDGGGTHPICLVDRILNVYSKEENIELWLITDGEIYMQDLHLCAERNKLIKYESIKFIIISQQQINLSVGAAFFSGSNVKIYRNTDLLKHIDTSKPFDYGNVNIGNYDEQIQKLSEYIQGKFMGQNYQDLEEIDKLTNLRKFLLSQLDKQDRNDERTTKLTFVSKNKTDILEQFKQLQFYKTLKNESVAGKRSEIDATISSLINYINCKNKSFEFQDLRNLHRNNKIAIVEEESLENESLESIEKVEFYDPVSLELEKTTPMVFLNTTDLIKKYWEDGKYTTFRRIVDCPFMADLSGSIGHTYSLETYESLRQHGQMINPMTNQPSHGGLIFGNTSGIHKWNDYIVAATYFRGKKVTPDFGVWYYMIWKEAVARAQWISPEIMAALKDYAFIRLENSEVRLGFSSLPLDPRERVPVPIACFYCTEGSSKLFGEDGAVFHQERLRMFYAVADAMIELMEACGYTDLDKKFILNRAKTFELMNKLKIIPKPVAKQYWLMEQIFQKVDKRFLICELRSDNDNTRLTPDALNILKYDHRTKIPFDWKDGNIQSALDNMEFGYSYPDKYEINLCPKTFRPFFVVEDKSSNSKVSNYMQILECAREVSMTSAGRIEVHKDPARTLKLPKLTSLCKLFINATFELKQFPSLTQYKDYVEKHKGLIGGERIFLFPTNILEQTIQIFELYQSMIKEYNLSVHEFIRITQKTTNRKTRIENEQTLDSVLHFKFLSDADTLLD